MNNTEENIEKYLIKSNHEIKTYSGYESIISSYNSELSLKEGYLMAFECYPGVDIDLLKHQFLENTDFDAIIDTSEFYVSTDEMKSILKYNITDDRIFGRISHHRLEDFLNEKFTEICESISKKIKEGIKIAIVGVGASLTGMHDSLVYIDITRWEIQSRYKSGNLSNFNLDNAGEDPLRMIKVGYFVEWQIADRHKKEVFNFADWYLDISNDNQPVQIAMNDYQDLLLEASQRPFSLVPFYDPGIWGGSWMQETFGVYKDKENLAWSFNGVPEENSVVFELPGGDVIESPANNIVFFQPDRLMGDMIVSRFGHNFPIRFNFLDTIGGQNLSLQVHPKTDYLQNTFGMYFTQDESYYVLHAENDSVVYLGLKEGVEFDELKDAFTEAQKGIVSFDDDKYINRVVMRKHDHYAIPSGTIHSSGKDSVILEISATPNRFTFKLWDWGRLDFDGLPRPVHLNHGLKNIYIYKDTKWVNDNLVNDFEVVDSGDGWIEEKTGLYRTEFIETRRHSFSSLVVHDTLNTVHVINLVDGDEVTITSPTKAFEPFALTYAQTVIIPAAVGRYDITPSGDVPCKTIKAYVR